MRYGKHVVLAAALTASLGACTANVSDGSGYYARPQYVYSTGYYSTPRYAAYVGLPGVYYGGHDWRYMSY
jgi:hypothetical protein